MRGYRMVYRIYVEKKKGFNVAAASLLHELQSFWV